MSARSNLVLGWLLVLLLQAPSPGEARRYALLVGVTEYPQLREKWGDARYDKQFRLQGPGNDVKVFQHLLQRDGLGFDPSRMTILAEDQGQPPTRRNIEQAFARLAQAVRPDDIVFILMSGHGTRLPLAPDAGDEERQAQREGFHEAFLPRDVIPGDEKASPRNIIRDDELGRWLRALDDKGAYVWIVLDCCHSGAMTRGMDEWPERSRFLTSSALGIPYEAMAASERHAAAYAASHTPRAAASQTVAGTTGLHRVVAFFASQPDEEALELPLPPPRPGQKADPRSVHGLLSFHVARALDECPQAVNYAELMQRIRDDYAGVQTLASKSMPYAEGRLDTQVLGLKTWPSRSQMVVSRRPDGQLELSAGAVQGITAGSVLAVYPSGLRPASRPAATMPSGQATIAPLGYVKVVDVGAVASSVEPCDRTGQPATELNLPKPSRRGWAELVSRDLGDMRIRVAVVDFGGSDNRPSRQLPKVLPPGQVPEEVAQALREMASEVGDVVQLTPDLWQADIVAWKQPDGLHMMVRPTIESDAPAGVAASQPAAEGNRLAYDTTYGPYDRSGFQQQMMKLYRWRNLAGIAGSSRSPTGDASGRDVEVVLCVSDDPHGSTWTPSTAGELPAGKYLQIEVRNRSAGPLDVTLLYLDEKFGVECLFPDRKRGLYDNRIPAGGNVRIKPLAITSSFTSRQEHFLSIAVPPRDELGRGDFSFLAQDPFASRGRTKGTTEAATPLGKLLTTAAFGGTADRGRSKALEHCEDQGTGATLALRSFRVVGRRAPRTFTAASRIALTACDLGQLLQPDPGQQVVPIERSRGLAGDDLFAKVAPAVVVVETRSRHGTGFLFGCEGYPEGYILTNSHVVRSGAWIDTDRQASTVRIHLGKLSDEGLIEPVKDAVTGLICAVDPRRDLALLKLDKVPAGIGPLPKLALADRSARPGQACAVVGHPASGMLWTFRTGHISQVGRMPQDMMDLVIARLAASSKERKTVEDQLRRLPSRRILLTNCGCNPGDPGGPTVDEDGRVVGVTFAIPAEASQARFSYHVHLEEVRAFLAEAHKEPALLVPDAWDIGPRIEMVDLFGQGRPQTLLAGTDRPRQVLIDLRGDTSEEVLASNDPDEIRKGFRAHLAIEQRDEGMAVFYDRDYDGQFDLVLLNDDEDSQADVQFVRRDKGTWVAQQTEADLLDPRQFKDPSTRKLVSLLDKKGLLARTSVLMRNEW